jgi:hypothetical protein
MRTAIRLAILSLALAGLAGAEQPLDGVFQVLPPRPTADPARPLIVIGSAPGKAGPTGMAVDRHGNVYVADQGDGSNGSGAIVMIPVDGRTPLRIVRDLTRPTALRLTADQRAMVIGSADGTIIVKPFGISVRIVNVDVIAHGTTVIVRTDTAPLPPAVGPSADKYHHIPEILVPTQLGLFVDITVEDQGKSKTFVGVHLGQPDESGLPFGETLVDITLPP